MHRFVSLITCLLLWTLPATAEPINQILGIPYAAPPVGDLRWQPPAPPRPHQKTLYHLSASCPQPAIQMGKRPAVQSEDCLYLNVWFPSNITSANHPVIVILHDGNLISGTSSDQNFSGAKLAESGAVVVTLNFRLGGLGFLNHPYLFQNNPVARGNFGLMDIHAALYWVLQNIGLYGGNPQNITLMGVGSGASLAGIILSSPTAPAMIQKTILVNPDIPSVLRSQTEKIGGLVSAETIGRHFAADLAITANTDQLNDWKRLPAETIVSAWSHVLSRLSTMEQNQSPQLQHHVVADGIYAADQPIRMLSQRPIAALIINDPDNYHSGLRLPRPANNETYTDWIKQNLPEWLPVMQRLYSKNRPVEQVHNFINDLHSCHNRDLALTLGKNQLPTYLGYVPTANKIIDHLFSTDPHTASSKRLTHYLVSFADTAIPNDDGYASWPTFDRNHYAYLNLDEAITGQKNFKLNICDMFNRHRLSLPE